MIEKAGDTTGKPTPMDRLWAVNDDARPDDAEALVVDVAGWGRNAAMAVLGAFVAVAWLVLRRVDDSPRVWSPEDELTGSRD